MSIRRVDAKLVYTLNIIEDLYEDLYGTGRQHEAYTVRIGRCGTPMEIASELRMAADALEDRFNTGKGS